MLSVAVFLGMAIGSNLWGSIADRYGRRLGVILSLTVEGIASVIASIAPNYAVLMTVRGIVGIGVGGLATCLSTYSEFLPTAFRGYGLCCFQLFWGLGAVSEAALAWLVVPRYGWRVLTFVTAMPSRNDARPLECTPSKMWLVHSATVAIRRRSARISALSARH